MFLILTINYALNVNLILPCKQFVFFHVDLKSKMAATTSQNFNIGPYMESEKKIQKVLKPNYVLPSSSFCLHNQIKFVCGLLHLSNKTDCYNIADILFKVLLISHNSYYQQKGWGPLNQFNPATFFSLSQSRILISNIICHGLISVQ